MSATTAPHTALSSANLCDLIPDPDNVRTHSPANIAAIEGSLRLFGQRKPVVVAANGDGTYTVVAGNGTLQAAVNLGWDTLDIAPIPDGWTSDQIRAYALADNKTAELAAWDMVELNAQLEELTLSGFDIGDIGFDLDAVISTEPAESTKVSLDLDDKHLTLLAQARTLTELSGRAADCAIVMAAYIALGGDNG